MAQYDGSIRINTKIDSKEASAQLMTLENRIVKTADKIAALRSKMNSIKDAKIPTEEYKEVSAQIQKAETDLNNLLRKQDQMQNEGKNNGIAWDRLNAKIDESRNTIRYAKGELQDLVDTGKAFTLGQDTEEFAKLSQQLQYAESDMDVLNKRHNELIVKQKSASSGYQKLGNVAESVFSKIGSLISKAGSGLKKFGGFVKSAFSSLTKSTQKSNGLLSAMASRFKGLTLSLLIFDQISKAFNAMISGIKEGFGNLYTEVDGFKRSVNGLKADMLTLKNSFAAAFRPLVEIAIPYIQKAVDALINFMNIIGQFTAAITGQETYTKAIRKTTEAIEDESKAQNKQLSGLDKLNNLTTDKSEKSSSSESEKMFEENVPISNGISKAADEIKKIFLGLFDPLKEAWEKKGKGVIESAKKMLASLMESAKSVGTTLYETFTGDIGIEWVESLIDKLNSIIDIIHSISTAFSTAWNSGAGNEAVTSIFNGLTQVNGLLSSIGDSFSRAFSGEIGIEIFENLLGILGGIFDVIGNIAGQIQIAWDTAGLGDSIWNGILGIANIILETIHNITDSTAGWARELDFTPLLESISRLLTSLQPLAENIGEGLEWFWNNVLLPVAGWVIEDAVPTFLDMLSAAIDSLNVIIDALKISFQWFWDEFLEPLGKWAGEKIISAMKKITDLLEKFGNWISEHKEEVSEFITIIGLLTAGFVGVKGSIALVNKILPLLKSGIKGVVTAITSPIGIVAALAALVVATGHGEEMIESLKKMLKGLIDFVTGVFTGNWKKAWEGVKSIFEGIGGAIKTVLNSIVDGINWVLEKIGILNKTKIEPKQASAAISGGSGLGSGLPRTYSAIPQVDIPGYATGQVIPRTMRQHLAVLGDNSKETEVVSPLSTIKKALREEVISLGLLNGKSDGVREVTIHVPLEVDGRTIFEIIRKIDLEEFERTKRPSFQI